MIEDVGLIIAQVADGILSEVGIIERQNFQVRQAVEVEDLFKAANFVTTDIEVNQADQIIKTGLDGVDLIASNPQLFQIDKGVEVFDALYFVITNPKGLNIGEVVEPLDIADVVMGQVKLLNIGAFVEPVDFGYVVLV